MRPFVRPLLLALALAAAIPAAAGFNNYVTKTASASVINQFDTYTYYLAWNFSGASSPFIFELWDTLPVNATYSSFAVSSGPGPNFVTITGQNVMFQWNGAPSFLTVPASGVVEIRVNSAGSLGSCFSNSACVSNNSPGGGVECGAAVVVCVATATPTLTRTSTRTPSFTNTPTVTPTATFCACSPTDSPTVSPTFSMSPTATSTAVASETSTPTQTPSQTATQSFTFTRTQTPTPSYSPTLSGTPSATPILPISPTLTATASPDDGLPGGHDVGGIDDDSLVIYPNPVANGQVRLAFTMSEGGKSRVRIFAVDGSQAGSYSREHRDPGLKSIRLDLGEYAPGVYIAVVDREGFSGKKRKTRVEKFIVVK